MAKPKKVDICPIHKIKRAHGFCFECSKEYKGRGAGIQ